MYVLLVVFEQTRNQEERYNTYRKAGRATFQTNRIEQSPGEGSFHPHIFSSLTRGDTFTALLLDCWGMFYLRATRELGSTITLARNPKEVDSSTRKIIRASRNKNNQARTKRNTTTEQQNNSGRDVLVFAGKKRLWNHVNHCAKRSTNGLEDLLTEISASKKGVALLEHFVLYLKSACIVRKRETATILFNEIDYKNDNRIDIQELEHFVDQGRHLRDKSAFTARPLHRGVSSAARTSKPPSMTLQRHKNRPRETSTDLHHYCSGNVERKFEHRQISGDGY